MLSQGNGAWCSKYLFSAQNKFYEEASSAYYSGSEKGQVFAEFPDIKDWRRKFPPTGQQLRDIYALEQRSTLLPSEISEHDRNTRDLQSWGCEHSTVSDHTFAVCKNYPNSTGAKACCTQGADIGYVTSVTLVESTSMSQAAHALEQCARCPNYRPTVIYTDTYPNLDELFKTVFDMGLVECLGLFHFMQRIVKIMRDSHESYGPAIQKLKRVIYHFNKIDEGALITPLRDGTMNGKRHTDKQIRDLQNSLRWTSRYGAYL